MLRVWGHWVSGRRAAFVAGELGAMALGCALGALVLTWALAPRGWRPPALAGIGWQIGVEAGALALALQFVFYAMDLYDLRVATEPSERTARLVRSAGAVALLAAGIALRWRLQPGALLGGAAGASLGALSLRATVGSWASAPRRVIVLGSGLKALALAKTMQDQGDEGWRIVEMIEPCRPGLPGASGKDAAAIVATVHKAGAEVLVVALDEQRGALPPEELLPLRAAGVPVYEAGAFCERALRRLPVTHFRASYLCFSDALTQRSFRRSMKRGFDLLAAGTMALLAAPVALLVAALIKMDSPGPVLYGQERVGRAGRAFFLWKFRSMRADAEAGGAVWAKVNDDRVTRVGRFIRLTRLDELPQLFNVIKGEMSFVGPRPERPVFVQQLKTQIPFYGLRELVKPGITGWAQIRYPYGASVEDARNKLELDLYYLKAGSLFLDLAILFHTIRHVVMARGAR